MADKTSDEQIDEARLGLEKFAEMAVETLRKDYYNPAEPFDVYAGRLKAQLVDQLSGYGDRLVHGYQVLLDEISKAA
jgi:hypothetical protein